MFDNLTMGNAVTATLGLIVLVSVILIRVLGDFFLIIPIVVGILAMQSAFTGFCPTEMLLRKYNLVK